MLPSGSTIFITLTVFCEGHLGMRLRVCLGYVRRATMSNVNALGKASPQATPRQYHAAQQLSSIHGQEGKVRERQKRVLELGRTQWRASRATQLARNFNSQQTCATTWSNPP